MFRQLSLFIIFFFYTLPLVAENFRFIQGEAILSLPHSSISSTGISVLSAHKLSRVKSSSFRALTNKKLSDSAIHISLKRKVRITATSKHFSKSRNPCNESVIKRLSRISGLTCEPNYEGQISRTPNDTLLPHMYSASTTSDGKIYLPEAWELSTGSSNVVVGIIDTGIDYNHQDLAANIWSNPGEIASNGIDDDGNGYIDDIHGIDPINNDTNPIDDQSHGTHVAGTIGGVGNNSRGVVGINWTVSQIACKAFSSAGTGTVSAIVTCLNYLVNLKNNFGINILVTNNSYGGFPYTNAMYNAIASSGDADIIYVAGAGNNGTNNDSTPFYPASFVLSNIISVGATDSQATKAGFSNFGASSVDISAPGVSILSTIRNNQYAYYNGTSMATPHVTGAIALIYAYRPSYVYSQVINSILSTGTVIAGLFGKNSTSSLLNVEEALKFEAPSPTPSPTPTPESPPSEDDPDISSAKLEISSVNLRNKSEITCELSALNGSEYIALENKTVNLVIKGTKAQRQGTTNSSGEVKFNVKLLKVKPTSVRCVARLPDSNGDFISVRSEFLSLGSKRRN